MPIYEIQCEACGQQGEVLVPNQTSVLICPVCGSSRTQKQMAPTSGLTGRSRQAHPGPGDTSCCGRRPDQAGCQGPGSCCGQR
jgi:putative FmdB family regulatory protein